MKRWLIWLLVIVALVVVIGGIKACQVQKMMAGFKAMGVPQMTVSTIRASYQDWQPEIGAVGTVRAVRGADLSAEVAGIVDRVAMESGQDVKAGQVLAQLRDADDRAHLQSLRATAALAQTVLTRDKGQYEAQAISKAALDSDTASLRSAQAQVAEQEAVLAKKSIRAPFAGRLGIRAVDPGQYLAAGTKVVTLQQLDPIYVDFNLPQQALSQVSVGQAVHAISDAYPGQSFAGIISAIDPKVDQDSRNVQVRASLPNPGDKLLPGMYAKVSVDAGANLRYVTLPLTAVSFNPYGASVYLVVDGTKEPPAADKQGDRKDAKDDGKDQAAAPPAGGTGPQLQAKQVFVTTGPTRGDQVAVLKGVKDGDTVVTSGQIKLHNGSPVVVDNSVQPANDANPAPQEE